MSTDLKTLTGTKEFSQESKELRLTRFYGGVRRGTCLQITLNYDYIQLDSQAVRELIKELIKSFPDWVD